jgi:hypothetical protein
LYDVPGFLVLDMVEEDEQRLQTVILSALLNQPRKLGTAICMVMIVMFPVPWGGTSTPLLLNITVITLVLERSVSMPTRSCGRCVCIRFFFATGAMGLLSGCLA